MNWNEIIVKIFEICVIPMLGVLTAYAVNYIKAKSTELSNKIDNEVAQQYIDRLSETITECVVATNQTYVDSLKNKGEFDAEAQKEAFQNTYNTVLNILTDDAKSCLQSIYGDLEAYVSQKIEAEVNILKNNKE